MKRLLKVFTLIAMAALVTIMSFQMNTYAAAAPVLSIDYANLNYGDKIDVLLAINVENTENSVTLLQWNSPQEDYTYGTQDYKSTNFEIQNLDGKDYQIFYSDGVSPKNFVDDLYFAACVYENETYYYSNVLKYSVLGYFKSQIASDTISDSQKAVFEAAINYGAAVQQLLDYKTEWLATEPSYSIQVVDGLLEDGFNNGVYKANDEFVLTANEKSGYTVDYWTDKDNNVVGFGEALKLEATSNNIYRPTYASCHTVTWLNWDDSVLLTSKVIDGRIPEYVGSYPEKNDGTEVVYSFISWDKELTEVTEDVTYKAMFEEVDETVTITFNTLGAEAIAPITKKAGDPISAPEIPTNYNPLMAFGGWYTDEACTDGHEFVFDVMPQTSITIFAKWIEYSLNAIVRDSNNTKAAINVDTEINAELFGLSCTDSNGDPVEVLLTKTVGNIEVGASVSFQFTATSNGKSKKYNITNVTVYGNPTIVVNSTKDYLNISEELTADLFEVVAKDSFNNELEVTPTIVTENPQVGEYITIRFTAKDATGLEVSTDIENVAYYGAPVLTYDSSIGNKKGVTPTANTFKAVAKDSFGNNLDVTCTYVGTTLAGYTITVTLSATDSKGNTTTESFNCRVYDTPSFQNIAKDYMSLSYTDLVDELGVVATDTFGEKIAVSLYSQPQLVAGQRNSIIFMATDCAGNFATKTYNMYVYDTPTITHTSNILSTTDLDNIISKLGLTAYDSFGEELTVSLRYSISELESGEATLQFIAADKCGNVQYHNIDVLIYDQNDILISATKPKGIKTTSNGEEFNAIAYDSFLEPCSISVEIVEGTLAAGQLVSAKIVATDAAGNVQESAIYNEIKVYGLPTYEKRYTYTSTSGYTDANAFIVKDSFGDNVEYEVTVLELYDCGSKYLNLKATDVAGNSIDVDLYYYTNHSTNKMVLDSTDINLEATCESAGSQTKHYHCEYCECENSVTSTIDALGHSLVDGTCEVCGKVLYTRNGNVITTGLYPQTMVTVEEVPELEAFISTINWPNRKYQQGYYSTTSSSKYKKNNYYQYADIDLDGDGIYDYRAMIMLEYLPKYTSNSSGSLEYLPT